MTGVSDLKVTDVISYYSEEEIDFSPPMIFLKHRLVMLYEFGIDFINGYSPEWIYYEDPWKQNHYYCKRMVLDFSTAFQTLNQLIEDAEEQKVYLPECMIEDYPLLAYQPHTFRCQAPSGKDGLLL